MNRNEQIAELQKILGTQKGVLARLKFLGRTEPCSRCGGSGEYSYCQQHGTTCFGCGGSGHQIPSKITKSFLEALAASVAAGDLEPYFESLRSVEAAKRAGKALLDDYANLTATEKKSLESWPGKKFWHVGSERGFFTRAVGSVFYTAARNLYFHLLFCKKDAQEKNRIAEAAKKFHVAMIEETCLFVPADASDEIVDTFKHSPEDALRFNTASNECRAKARERCKEIASQIPEDLANIALKP